MLLNKVRSQIYSIKIFLEDPAEEIMFRMKKIFFTEDKHTND